MKILLINPYYSFTKSAYVFYRASVPYNLLYIAGYLRKHGVETKIVELGIFNEKDAISDGDKIRCGVDDYAIKTLLAVEQPDIVGIGTMYTVFHNDYVEIIKTIKEFNPDIRVVVGGNHASVFPGLMLESGADQVVVGEGEEAFLSIVRGNKNKIIKKSFIENLDEIPFPAYDLIAFNRYLEVSNPFNMRTPTAPIITSRGCPNNCVYCTVGGVWGRVWRGRSPTDVVNEMQFLMKEYGIKAFSIQDDNMMVDKKRMLGICREIRNRKLDIKWAAPASYWNLDFELLEKMKDAGCYRLSFGIESGDEDTRKFIRKTYPLSKAIDIIEHANRIGIWTVTTNIVGFPFETEPQILNTLLFNKISGTDFACFFCLIPHPSSDVFKYYADKEFKNWMSVMNEGGCDSNVLTKEEIKKLQKYCYSEFVKFKARDLAFHPIKLLRKIRSVEDLLYVWKLVSMGFSMWRRSKQKVSSSKDFIYGRRQYV